MSLPTALNFVRSTRWSATLSIGLALALTGCQAQHDHDHDHDHGAAAWADVKELVAVMVPTAGNTTAGTITFEQQGDKVKVVANISGLQPGQQHAFHIHEWGDLRSDDGTATGGHYNPEGHDHGLPDQEHRHAGDLGNLQADDAGNATYEITVDNLSLGGGKNPIVGRAVIIHAKPDDGGQPTGNAGARISHGVIGVAKP